MTKRSFRGLSAPRALRVLGIVSLAVAVTACSSKTPRADRPDNPFRTGQQDGPGSTTPQSEKALKLEASQAYRLAHDALQTGDYETANKRFTQLIARYPFTEYSTQAELEKIFAQYRSFQPDEAVLAADRFLREHPRHPRADYVQYLKGLTNSARSNGISDFLPLDTSKKDVLNERRAFDDFALLLQRYPTSLYAGDARKRMVYLRNRIASHELSIVKFYVKRQAWVAVSKRAENLIAEYPGAPATAEALTLLKLSYNKLGLKPQSEDITKIIAANTNSIRLADARPPKPGPRSVVGEDGAVVSALVVPSASAAPEAAQAAAAAPEAPEAPKGFFGRIGSFFDALNKTYTIGKDDAAPAPAAAAPATRSAKPAASSNDTPSASLTTGPYSGPDTVIEIAPATPSAAPVPTAGPTPADGAPKSPGNVLAAPAPPQPPADGAPKSPAASATKPKEKGGFLDFLNKSYDIGGSKKKPDAAAPAADGATPAAADATATSADQAGEEKTETPKPADAGQ